MNKKKGPFTIFAPSYPATFLPCPMKPADLSAAQQEVMNNLANALGVTMEMTVIHDPTFSSARAFLEEEAKRLREFKGMWAGVSAELLQDYLANAVIIENEYVGNIKPRADHLVLPTRHTQESQHDQAR